MATIDELRVGDAPESWAALGFEVDGDTCVVGDVRIRLAGTEAGKGLDGLVAARLRGRPSWTGCRLRGRIARRPPSRRCIPTASPRSTTWSRSARPRSHRRRAADRRSRPAPHPRGADARGRSAAGVLPPRRGHPRGRAGSRRRRSSGRGRPTCLLLGPRLRRPRPRRDRRRTRGSRQRDPPGRSARPPHRDPSPLRRSLGSGRADDAGIDHGVAEMRLRAEESVATRLALLCQRPPQRLVERLRRDAERLGARSGR